MSLQISNDFRTIAIPDDITFLGVEGDKNVKTLDFTMPSQADGIDLSGYDITINFKNIERGRVRKSEGSYVIAAAAVLDGTISFSWQIEERACRYHGDTWFSVSLKNGGSNTFNTQWVSLPVLKKQACRYPSEDVLDGEILNLDMGSAKLLVSSEILTIS